MVFIPSYMASLNYTIALRNVVSTVGSSTYNMTPHMATVWNPLKSTL